MSTWSDLQIPVIVLSGLVGGSVSFISLTQKGRMGWRKFRAWRNSQRAKRIAEQHKDLAKAVAEAVRIEIQPVRHEFENNGGTGLKERFVAFETNFSEFRIETNGRLSNIEVEQQHVKKEVAKQADRVDDLLVRLAAGGRS